MPFKAKKIQTLDVPLVAKPGALAQVYGAFKEAGINVIASWGYQMGPNEAQAHFYVSDIEKTRNVLTKMGMKPTLTDACWVEGDDKIGQYAEVLGKVAKAGVNISATDAFSIGNRWATVLFADNAAEAKNMWKALEI